MRRAIGWYGLNKGKRLAGFGQITENILNVLMVRRQFYGEFVRLLTL